MNTDKEKIEEEIDIKEIIWKLWRNRKFIIKTTIIAAVIGLVYALTASKVYTSGSTMVPQVGDKSSIGGSLGGLAAMAGINLGSAGSSGGVLSPDVYPQVINSAAFLKELMYKEISFSGIDKKITLYEYYTNKEYSKFSLLGFVKKYTLGLPGLIIGAFKGEEKSIISNDNSGLVKLTKDEYKVLKIMKDNISLSVNKKEGYITLSVNMPDALSAANVAKEAQTMLQNYITKFKVEKVSSNLEFVQGRYNDVKKEFEAKQEELAKFKDANLNFSSAVAEIKEKKLTSEYNLVYGLYTELAKQLESARISVKETTPILTVIDPVTVPLKPEKPKKAMLLVMFTFLGFIIGAGYILAIPTIAEFTNNKKLLDRVK